MCLCVPACVCARARRVHRVLTSSVRYYLDIAIVILQFAISKPQASAEQTLFKFLNIGVD